MARESTTKMKAAANETASRVAARAETVAGQKKGEVAERVDAYGSAIHDSAKALEEQDPNIAWLTHQAADRLQSVASYLRDRDFGGLRADAENLARRHPAAFFGGMCVAGLVLGSVIKASQRAANSTSPAPSAEGASSAGFATEVAEDQTPVTEATAAPAAGI